MRTQPIDPMAQAMQILQFITQRRGQQAGIEQDNRRLDLQEAQQQMAGEQFGQTMDFNQQKQQQDALQFAREMALRELAQRQGAQQFGKRMSFDEQQAQMVQQRFEEEQRQREVDRAFRRTQAEREFGVTAPYQQAITNQINQRLMGKDKDPQLQMLEESQFENAMKILQERFNAAPNAIERSRIQDQMTAAMAQRYQKLLPPLRDYTPKELETIQIYQ